MSKFKVGDRVKIIRSDDDAFVGTVSKIKSISRWSQSSRKAWNLEQATPGYFWTENELELIKEKTMSKYYRVKVNTATWDQGAILEHDGDSNYEAVSDVWNTEAVDKAGSYAELAAIVENAPDFFEQVYPIGKLEKMVFGSKKQAQAAASAMYKGGK